MITFPNCKINIGLHVVGRRADGYHDLQTVFLPVHDLHDELEIVATSDAECRMTQDGIALDNAPEDNLCVKAWRLLHDKLGVPPVSIRLRKMIPYGAGLGGGSADAAFTLKMLNTMFSLGLDDIALEGYAARLGADCAFFVRNRAAYATGVGDRLETFDVDMSGYNIVIEIPDGEHVSTREAYGGLDGSMFGQPRVDLRKAVCRPVREWRDVVVNDFEASVFRTHPAIAALKDDMYRRGALYASMTGSGAAVYGVFHLGTPASRRHEKCIGNTTI